MSDNNIVKKGGKQPPTPAPDPRPGISPPTPPPSRSFFLDDLTTRILTLEAENRRLREVATRWRAKAQNLRVAVDTVLTGPRAAEVIRRSRAGQEGLLGLPWTDDPTWEGEL